MMEVGLIPLKLIVLGSLIILSVMGGYYNTIEYINASVTPNLTGRKSIMEKHFKLTWVCLVFTVIFGYMFGMALLELITAWR